MTSTNASAAAATYYRTGKGSHRHASWYCANFSRSVFTGDVLTIPADEVNDWAPCVKCCEDVEVAAAEAAAQAAPAAPANCRNSGVTHTRRIYSTCVDCGKEGKVTNNGVLRAHKPAN